MYVCEGEGCMYNMGEGTVGECVWRGATNALLSTHSSSR